MSRFLGWWRVQISCLACYFLAKLFSNPCGHWIILSTSSFKPPFGLSWILEYFPLFPAFLILVFSRPLLTQQFMLFLVLNVEFVSFVFQNRPSVITCAPANNRNCNLSHCPVSHNGCASLPNNYRRINSECSYSSASWWTDRQTSSLFSLSKYIEFFLYLISS